MNGDFTRLPSAREGKYDRVLLQQGRVQLDSDWNEQVEIFARRERAALEDLIGAHGGPAGSRGFELTVWNSVRFENASEQFQAAPIAFPDDHPFTIETWILVDKSARGGKIASTWDGQEHTGFELGFDSERRLFFRRGEVEDQTVTRVETEEFVFGDVEVEVRHKVSQEVVRNVECTLRSHEQLPDGRFVHLVATFDGSRLDLFVDGLLVAHSTRSRRAADSDGQLVLGGFAGQMSRTRIWSESVSQSAVSSLRALRSSRSGHAVVDYRFDEVSGDSLLDGSGHDRHAVFSGSAAQWRHGLWIGKGRYYVSGLACENPNDVSFENQPQYPAAKMPGPGRYLAYVKVWQRHVTSLEDPTLREVALPGDTSTRVETVSQVRLLPVDGPQEPDAAEDFGQWQSLLVQSHSHGRLRVRRTVYDHNLDNLLYRIEIHSGGVPRSHDSKAGICVVESWDSSVRSLRLRKWTTDGLPWQAGDVIEASTEGTDAIPASRVIATVESVAADQQTLVLDNSSQDWTIDAPHSIRRLPTFKWSRLNGSRSYPISSIDSGGRVALATGHEDRVPIREGDWIEIFTRSSSLNEEVSNLYQVVDLNQASQQIRLNGSPKVSDEPMFLRCWEQGENAVLPVSGTVAVRAGGWNAIENGIEVEFDGNGLLQPGDFWSFTSRNASGGVEWPLEDGRPAFQPPHGCDRTYAPLSLIEIDADGRTEIKKSYRRTFDRLVGITQEEVDYVRRSGDTMTGPLRIQDSLRVAGDVHAKRLFGALPENSVGSDQLLDFSVSEPKLSFDLGIELSGSLLRESPEPFPGHRFTGAHIIVPAAGPPQMDSRGLRAVAIGQSIFVLDKQGSWLIHPHEHRTVQCPPVPTTFETFALAASSEEAFLFSGSDDPMTLVYEKSSASWRTSVPPPVPLIDAQAAYHHGLVYVVGGLKGPRIWRAASKRLLVFDPAQNSWWELAEMPTALAGAAFASEGAGLLLTGGYRPRFGGWLGIRRHRSSFYFHPSTEHWSQRSPVPDPNLGENLCSIGPDLVLPSKTGRPQVYRGSGGRWTTSDAFDARTGGCFVSTGTDLYRIERDREGHPSAVLLAKALFVFSIEK